MDRRTVTELSTLSTSCINVIVGFPVPLFGPEVAFLSGICNDDAVTAGTSLAPVSSSATSCMSISTCYFSSSDIYSTLNLLGSSP